jgi:hypothetical protein
MRGAPGLVAARAIGVGGEADFRLFLALGVQFAGAVTALAVCVVVRTEGVPAHVLVADFTLFGTGKLRGTRNDCRAVIVADLRGRPRRHARDHPAENRDEEPGACPETMTGICILVIQPIPLSSLIDFPQPPVPS